nr:RHS repeat-associated core domain-containing protein [Flavobacterium amniphilum]
MGELINDEAEPLNNLVTWIYQQRTFVPSAKIQGEERFSIISDYIGRPVQAYNENGSLLWQTDYDIYGRLRNLQGDEQFVPFRQLGQYEDVELEGLYYNRFRYYSPDTGLYLSQDPIRLLGNNPTFYAYVTDSNSYIDPFGLDMYVILGEGQDAVENYAKQMRELFPDSEFRTIRKDWNSIVKNSGANKEVFGSAEWELKANQGNADWIVDRHNDGYKFIDIGEDAAPHRSSFYKTEKATLSSIGATVYRGSGRQINKARANAKTSNRPKSKINCG